MTREGGFFVLVGLAALATHWLVLVLLVSLAGLDPLVANVLGFAVAFQVSYFGHRHLTFAAGHRAHGRTFPRFLAVALAMFMLNAALYWLLLTATPLRYDIAHLLVLGTVAGLTYLLGKLWAFA